MGAGGEYRMEGVKVREDIEREKRNGRKERVEFFFLRHRTRRVLQNDEFGR